MSSVIDIMSTKLDLGVRQRRHCLEFNLWLPAGKGSNELSHR